MHDDNCFITLTYNKLPDKGSLVRKDFVLFMKRLRQFLVREGHANVIRFFMCGEYGEQLSRPHYHACIFGFDFRVYDKEVLKLPPDLQSDWNGFQLHRSATLDKIWSVEAKDEHGELIKQRIGFATVGDVNFKSAAYVARYIMKKITGKPAADHYCGKQDEYVTMSLKPGIGGDWFLDNVGSVFPDSAVTLRGGVKCAVPRYYDKKYEEKYPIEYGKIKAARLEHAKEQDTSPETLKAKEKIKKAQITSLKRGFENGI